MREYTVRPYHAEAWQKISPLWFFLMFFFQAPLAWAQAPAPRVDPDHALREADSLMNWKLPEAALSRYQVALRGFEQTRECRGMLAAAAGEAWVKGLREVPEDGIKRLKALLKQVDCCSEKEEVLQGKLYTYLADIYDSQREFDRSLHFRKLALAHWEQSKGDIHPEAIKALMQLGRSYLHKNQKQIADSIFVQAHEWYQLGMKKDPVLLASVCFSLGETSRSLAKYPQALQWYEQSLQLYQKQLTYNHPLITDAMAALGFVNGLIGQHEKAATYLQKALALQKNLWGHYNLSVAKSLYQLGYIYLYSGQFTKARLYLNEALAIYECLETKDPGLVHLYAALGHLNTMLEEKNCTREYYENALNTLQKMKSPRANDMAMVTGGLGNFYFSMGMFEQALTYYQMAMHQYSALRDGQQLNIGTAYYNMGMTCIEVEQLDLAVMYLQNALDILINKLGSDHRVVSYCYQAIGVVLFRGNQFQKAITYFQKALERMSEYEKLPKSVINHYLGMLYAKNDPANPVLDFDLALTYFHKSLAIKKEIIDPHSSKIAFTLREIGRTHLSMGQYQKARDFNQRAIDIEKQFQDSQNPALAAHYNLQGEILRRQHHYEQSLKAFEQAIASNLLEREGTLTNADYLQDYLQGITLLKSLQGKATVGALLGFDQDEVIAIYQQCDELIGQLRTAFYLESDQIELGNIAADVYEEAIAACLQHKTGKLLAQEAYAFSEKSKAMVLYRLLRQQNMEYRQDIPAQLIQNEQQLRREQTQIRQQLIDEKDANQKVLLRARLFRTIADHRKLLSYLKETHPVYFSDHYANDVPQVDQIQRQLAPTESLIEYFIGDSTLTTFTLTQDHLVVSTQPVTDSLLKDLEQLMGQFTVAPDLENLRPEAYTRHATALFDLLLAKSLSQLPEKIQSLIIVPSGPLTQLNFGALVRSEGPRQAADFATLPYLIRDYAFHYAASGGLWLQSIQRSQNLAIRPPTYAFGGFAPIYDSLATPHESLPDMVTELVREGQLPLPGAQKEVQRIAAIMDGHAWVGTEASRQKFCERAKDYQVIHLAMHTLLDDENPLNSCLVFSSDDATNKPKGEKGSDTTSVSAGTFSADRLLYASEIYNMQLPSRMAVLSACQSGVGKVEKGEGVMGLSRAFMYAGCPTLTISLWDVPDMASSEIMVSYYDHLSKALPVHEALRRAQLYYLNKYTHPVFSHPYYWAPFITLGNAQPITFQNNHRTLEARFLGLVLLLVAGLVITAIARYRKFRPPAPDPS